MADYRIVQMKDKKYYIQYWLAKDLFTGKDYNNWVYARSKTYVSYYEALADLKVVALERLADYLGSTEVSEVKFNCDEEGNLQCLE